MTADQEPLFSVIMPTYRRCSVLERVLDAWEHQAGTVPFEVIVVDDGSDDGEDSISESDGTSSLGTQPLGTQPLGTLPLLTRRRPTRHGWRIATQTNAGPAAARNRALRMARGTFVLFVGDDIEPTPDLLSNHWAAHQRYDDPHVVILGLTRWPPGEAVTATMRHIDGAGAQQFSYYYLEDGACYDFRHFYTSNVSIRRSLLDREPTYFSTDFPAAAFEDAEFADRLARHGAKIIYHAAPVAYHHHHYEAPGFFRRQRRCGQMGAILFGKRPGLAKHLRTREASWARLDYVSAPSATRTRVVAVSKDLPHWHRRALSLASFYDPIDPPGIDALLAPLFQYGYDLGLLAARYGEDEGTTVAAHLFLRDVLPAVEHFVENSRDTKLPLPEADWTALQQLVVD